MLIMLTLGFVGLLLIIVGICFHLGYCRGIIVYWSTGTSSIYAAVPTGIGLSILGFAPLVSTPDTRGYFLVLAAICLVISIIFGLTMPQFLTPHWFRYLREEYDEFFLRILLKDAAEDYIGWKERTKTIEGLVSWANEVERKTKIERKA